MRRTKRFQEGGETEPEVGEGLSAALNTGAYSAQRKERSDDELSFSEAFRKGRAARLAGGPKTFMWRGKEYGTDLAGEAKPRKAAPRRMSNEEFLGEYNRSEPSERMRREAADEVAKSRPKTSSAMERMGRQDFGGVSWGDPEMTREEQERIALGTAAGAAALAGGQGLAALKTARNAPELLRLAGPREVPRLTGPRDLPRLTGPRDLPRLPKPETPAPRAKPTSRAIRPNKPETSTRSATSRAIRPNKPETSTRSATSRAIRPNKPETRPARKIRANRVKEEGTSPSPEIQERFRRLKESGGMGSGRGVGRQYASGGYVKAFAKGGVVRGGGCETKGKTRGRFV